MNTNQSIPTLKTLKADLKTLEAELLTIPRCHPTEAEMAIHGMRRAYALCNPRIVEVKSLIAQVEHIMGCYYNVNLMSGRDLDA